MPDRRATMKRICRGCGCADDRACLTDGLGSCFWVLFDIASPSGICSACADDWEWDAKTMALIGWKELQRAGVTGLAAP